MNPTLVIVTGPSGAGKSTFCKHQADWENSIFNLDDWARTEGDVEESGTRERAWRRLSENVRKSISEHRSPIVLDHVLETVSIDRLVVPAKDSGYSIHSWFVCPESADICVERVAKRKREGGHGRSTSTILKIYENAPSAASELSIVSDRTYLVDSTRAFLVIACISNYRSDLYHREVPVWAKEHFIKNGAYDISLEEWQDGEGDSVKIGKINRRGQLCCGTRGVMGTDKNQYAYKVCCTRCEHVYGANGSDMYERKCPECQGGEPGIDF